jgi:PAS domain S-box-containing protein
MEGWPGSVISVMAYISNMYTTLIERRDTWLALLKSERELREAQRVSRMGNWRWDPVERRGECSEEVYEICGLEHGLGPEELMTAYLSSIHPDDRPALEKVLAGEESPEGREFRIRLKDGSERWLWYEPSPPAPPGQGRPGELSGIIQDITERKRAEAERLAMEQHLQDAQRLESLGILAGGIAHDFNNLLGSVFGYIDLALLETMSAKARSRLESAMGSIDQARGLTQQLLTFAKGGAPSLKLDRLHPFIREAALFAMSGRTATYSEDVDPDLRCCEYDRSQIGQVVGNLVINALQAMPAGGKIRLAARNVVLAAGQVPGLPSGDFVAFSIADQGMGMPPEILAHAFDPFFTTKKAGSGLGLTIAYSIIKRHGGAIQVESEPGRGSRFTVYLPARDGKPEPEPPTAPALSKLGGDVLAMDDEEEIRGAIGEMLLALGCRPALARDGLEAIRLLKEALAEGRRFRAAILDLTVQGGMGGAETAPHLRALDPGLPLCVSSGYADDPAIPDPAGSGFDASLAKPYSLAELERTLRRICRPAGEETKAQG